MIVCYDASASPGRNIQRMGRTGRHGDGRVVYVLAAGKETEKYYRSLTVRLAFVQIVSEGLLHLRQLSCCCKLHSPAEMDNGHLALQYKSLMISYIINTSQIAKAAAGPAAEDRVFSD